jgi:hypothetical protein
VAKIEIYIAKEVVSQFTLAPTITGNIGNVSAVTLYSVTDTERKGQMK